MSLLLKNAKIIGTNSKKSFDLKNVLIENHKISQITDISNTLEASEVLDLKGAFLSVGLIDPQVHFREPGFEYKEDLESGSLAAARGGFTTVICMPNTKPASDSPEVIDHIVKRSQEIGVCKVLPTACISMGLKGEEFPDYQALKKAGAIAFTDDGRGVQSDEFMYKAMEEIAKLKMPLLDHSEDETLSNKGVIHLGEVSKRHGVPGIDASSEAAHVKRGCDYALKTKCHFHVLHISTKASIEAVRVAKSLGAPVTAEVSPHHLLLCDEDINVLENGLDANFKMNPPLRSKEDKEECVKALLDGTIDMIATDHAPHSAEEKAQGILKAPFGIVGVETAFPLMYTHFVKTNLLSLERLIDLMSTAPAKLFSLPRPELKVGAIADLTVIDLDAETEIRASEFLSKGKNTPFEGWRVKGKTLMTLLEGKVVYRSENN